MKRENGLREISKVSNLPYKVLTVRTERRLLEEAWNELVVLHVVDVLLLQGPLAAADLEAELRVHIVGRTLFIAVFFVFRHFEGPVGGSFFALRKPLELVGAG